MHDPKPPLDDANAARGCLSMVVLLFIAACLWAAVGYGIWWVVR